VQPPSKDTIATLYDQLERKQELILSLDAKILEDTTDNTEIETEILQTEEINSSISVPKEKITQHINPSILAVTPPQRTDHHRGLILTPSHHPCQFISMLTNFLSWIYRSLLEIPFTGSCI